MGIKFHPEPGAVLICDLDGMKFSEMQKRKPAVVISPSLKSRVGLCTVVPLSTTEPKKIDPS